MGWQNVLDANGISLALAGMFIVFSGLVIISLYIASMPRFFEWLGMNGHRFRPRIRAAGEGKMDSEPMAWEDEELLAALGYVIQMEFERERAAHDERITIRQDELNRGWTVVGKMRTLSARM